ncbi:NUDIX domain-containing protein [Shewanella sp. YIC-542]|uniref:NUDIX domain-containing protein n=1 Tax=Shewanella mytili TaxID=3377111 RepID=UPI00398F6D05
MLNNKNQILLQRRCKDKYHSGGLWSNTCCSHPNINEHIKNTANRRLKEEMGISCGLRRIFTLQYNLKCDNNLIENELTHVLYGFFMSFHV